MIGHLHVYIYNLILSIVAYICMDSSTFYHVDSSIYSYILVIVAIIAACYSEELCFQGLIWSS